jgi:glycosyltransferase involved in cell wall biosynthesis
MVDKSKKLIILPAYNEENVIKDTLESLQKIDADLLVIDDGSVDDTRKISKEMGVDIVSHTLNLGLGAALQTGILAAKRRGYDVLITFDADGQHSPKDINKLVEGLKDADIVIGIRCVHSERMPFVKKVGNTILNLLTAIFFGIYSKDSQSGLRAFNRKAIVSIDLRAVGYEVSSEIIYEARRHGLKVKEVPVEVIYTDHSISRGTGVFDGFKIFWSMILHRRIR